MAKTRSQSLSQSSLLFKFSTDNTYPVNVEDSFVASLASNSVSLSLDVPKVKPGSVAKASEQVLTGNIAIDYTNPIPEGTLVTIDGPTNSDKTSLALQTALNFMKERETGHIVYFTTVAAQAKKAIELFKENGVTSYTVILPKDPMSHTSIYTNIQAMTRYTVSLKDSGKKVLAIVDNIEKPLNSALQISRDLGFPLVN